MSKQDENTGRFVPDEKEQPEPKTRPGVSTTPIRTRQLEAQDSAHKVTSGRKKFTLDDEKYREIEELAAIGCTDAEISVIIGCSPRTFIKLKAEEIADDGDFSRLCLSLERGKARANRSIRRALFDKIDKGNSACIIFACKSILGLHEHREISHTITADISGMSDEELARKVLEIAKKSGENPVRKSNKSVPGQATK